MKDKELWELCESSGFVNSQRWPTETISVSKPALLAMHQDGSWGWAGMYGFEDRERASDARARILAGLVEWSTQDGLYLAYMDYEDGLCNVRVEAADDGEWSSVQPTREAALLDCFRQWKESQCKA